MAKSGTTSRLPSSERRDAEGTKERMVRAAIAALCDVGFAGASAREIARRADCNQALVFYHFGSVANLLLAALDETSRVRMARYAAAVDGLRDPVELARVGLDIFREDLDAGHVTVLAELIAGASSTPGLGAEVATRIATWTEFVQQVVLAATEGSPLAALLAPSDAAFGVVALYLGIELLTHLDDDRRPAESLLASVQRLAGLVGALTGSGAGPAPGPGPQAEPDRPVAGSRR